MTSPYEQFLSRRELVAKKLRLLLDEKTEHPPSVVIPIGDGRLIVEQAQARKRPPRKKQD